MGNFEFTKDHKKILNYLSKFGVKLTIMMVSGYISSHFTKIDLINYKKNTFAQIFTFMVFEEIINSYIPKWKDDKKPKLTKAKKLVFASPINVSPGKKLNPAHHISPAKTLDPAHHEL